MVPWLVVAVTRLLIWRVVAIAIIRRSASSLNVPLRLLRLLLRWLRLLPLSLTTAALLIAIGMAIARVAVVVVAIVVAVVVIVVESRKL